jgi:hypothetical protein
VGSLMEPVVGDYTSAPKECAVIVWELLLYRCCKQLSVGWCSDGFLRVVKWAVPEASYHRTWFAQECVGRSLTLHVPCVLL